MRLGASSPLVRKVRRRWDRLRHGRGFSTAETVDRVRRGIAAAGLDPDAGQKRLDAVLAGLRDAPFDFGRDSVHWLLFACLAEREGDAARILELGTFDGAFTAILARLFPAAEITTIDLPESDPILRTSYDREEDDAYRAFVRKRDANVAAPNVRALAVNSVFLLDHVDGPFDLVWVDAGHLYPEVAWDLANARHLCRPGGALLCDDVLDEDGESTDYVSPDSLHVLRYLEARTDDRLSLHLKRCSRKSAAVPRTRKYVALLERAPD